MNNNTDNNIDKNKNHLILFTTKWFEKDTNNKPYLFSVNNCKVDMLLDNKSSVYKHTFEFLKPDIIYNAIEKNFNDNDFINKITKFEHLANQDTNLAEATFNGKPINNDYYSYYNMNYENKFKKYSGLKSIKGNLKEGLKGLSNAYPKSMNFLFEYIQASNLLTMDDIYKDNKKFSSRTKIWKIKYKEIYAYRCLDLQYNDEVLSVKGKGHPREGFITAILEDIGKSKNINLDRLFNDYQITFVLHRDEINFPQITKKLSDEEIKDHLLAFNNKLNFKDKIKNVIVFQHDHGIIPEILSTSNSNISAQDIYNDIIVYFEFREQFKTQEKETFKLLNSNDLKKINIDKIDELMKDFKKKTSDNAKLF